MNRQLEYGNSQVNIIATPTRGDSSLGYNTVADIDRISDLEQLKKYAK